jgi:transcriptional regulator with XRE-family HTH domain
MSETLKPVSETLKALRKEHGLTIASLATGADLSCVYISEMESGRKVPTDGKMLFKLAQFYKFPFTPLLKAAFNQAYMKVRAKYPEDAE